MSVAPHPALVRTFEAAYRCRHVRSHGGSCPESRWHPETGHVPRGFLGATDTLDDVELIMVLAEPGNPQGDESYDPALYGAAMAKQTMAFVFRCYAEKRGPVQKHGRWFLDQRFPGMSFTDQLRHVWITEARLCSLDEAGGAATAEHYLACGRDYLASQLALLPRARIVAFGSKAKAAMKRRGRSFIDAHALAPRNVTTARATWQEALRELSRLDASG